MLQHRDRRFTLHLERLADRLIKLWLDEDGVIGSRGVIWQAPVHALFSAGPNAALLTLPDVALFLADSAYELVEVAELHETLGTDAGAVTLDVKKATGTQAATAGTTMLASTFNLKATINTVVRKNVSNGGLATAQGTRQLATGDRAAIDFGGVMTAVTGVHVHGVFKPLRRPAY